MRLKDLRISSRVAGAALLAFVAVPAAQADYQSTVLSQGPVGYWRLNETIQPLAPPINATNIGSVGSPAGNGTYNDAIRGVTPGAIVSEPANGAVKFIAAVDGNRVRIPYQPQWNTAGPFSVEFWIRPDRTNATQCIAADVEFIASPAAQRNGWLIYQGNSPTLDDGQGWSFRLYNSTGLAALSRADWVGPLNPNAWYHLVGTFDGTHILLYVNGSLAASNAIAGTFRPNTNSAIPLTFGSRADGASGYYASAASFDEAAYYTTALTALQVTNHYAAGILASPATPYQQVVLGDSPVGYWRFGEPADPIAANLGTFGAAADAKYNSPAVAGVTGPRPAAYPGFEALNYAVGFNGTGGSVAVPALNLNTNTVTISCWINAIGAQAVAAGLVIGGSGANASGLTIDQYFSGLGLGAIWNGQNYGWSPSADHGLPALPDSGWAYAALVIRPSQVELYICDANNFASFTSVTNISAVNANQAFAGSTLFGAEAGSTTHNFNGAIDEVAIFNRALAAGELYSQYAAAGGGVPPRIFADLQGPTDTVPIGDPIVLTVEAGGTPPLTYTWHKVGGGTIATTTNGVLTIADAALSDGGKYDVTISNGSGNAPSQKVDVTVGTASPPTITDLQGFQDRTLYPGGTLNLAVTATGGGLKYQWYKGGTPIASATASAYIVASVTNSHAGSYSVTITNTMGSASNGPVAIAIPTTVAGSYEALVIASAPEAWWRLDEPAGSTNLFDGMGRHDGIYTNLTGANPPVALGVPGALVGDTNTGASFSGDQGLGVIPFSPAFSPAKFTIEGWVRTTVTDDPNLSPFSSSYGAGGHYWRTSPAGEWRANSSTQTTPLKDNGQTNAVVVNNQWTHLVMAYDSSTAGFPWIYAINGLRLTTSWSGAGPNVEGPFIIGGHGVSATTLADLFWKGQVDEVAVYPRVLSNAEIAAHYAARGVEILPPTFGGPLLSQTVTTGKGISFSTTVFGTSPALQWYKDGAPISLATNTSITITSAAIADSGTYTLWATNAAGTNSVSATLTVIAPVSYANVTNGLVLHLRFDGDATDSSGRGNNGTPTVSPAPVFVSGLIGAQALQYTTVTNGETPAVVTSASYVSLGTAGSGPPADLQFGSATSFTVGLWVKLPAGATPGDLPFIGTETNSMNSPGWGLGPTYQTGGWQWCLNDSVNNIDTGGPSGSINDGAWHNFVLTVDRTAKVAGTYLDGVLVASRDITALGSIDNNNHWPLAIGQDPTGLYPEAGSATLDDLGIWRRALTPLEVAQIQSAGSTGHRSFDTVNPSVTITVTWSGSDLKLSWATGTLFQSGTLDASAVWTPVPGASAPSYTFTPGPTNNFYRVLVQ